MLFSQSRDSGEPPVLQRIKKYYGGTINESSRKRVNSRTEYTLVLPHSTMPTFLEHMCLHGIIKKPQAIVALNWLKGEISDTCAMEEIFRLKTQYYQIVDIPKERFTPASMAGIFEAEGCVRMKDGSVSVAIAQKQCINYLNAMKEVTGGAVIHGQLVLHADTAISFLRKIQPILQHGGKRDQVDVIFKYLEERTTQKGFKRTPKQAEFLQTTEHALKKLKKM